MGLNSYADYTYLKEYMFLDGPCSDNIEGSPSGCCHSTPFGEWCVLGEIIYTDEAVITCSRISICDDLRWG
jgi:hypothetical protein